MLLAEELLHHWRGVEGWFDHTDPRDKSDYARACRVNGWLGTISCHNGTAVVFSGDVGMIAWMPNPIDDSGFLVQWLGIDDEESIEPALRSEAVASLLGSPDAETLEFETGPSGKMRLFDSAYMGDDVFGSQLRPKLIDSELLRLKPGRHLMRANYFKSETIMMVVREISPL